MRITKNRLKEIIKEEIQKLREGNFQEEYCRNNPGAEGCLEYWQEEARAEGIGEDNVDFNDAKALISAIDKMGN